VQRCRHDTRHNRHLVEVHSSLNRVVGLPWAVQRKPGSVSVTRLFVLGLLAAATAWAVLIALTATNPTTHGLIVGYRLYAIATPAAVGLLWWRRRPEARIGTMLMLLAVFAAVMAWQTSAFPYPFAFGVLAEAPCVAVAFMLCLSFPTGRLEGHIARSLMGLVGVTLLLTFVPWLISGPTIHGSNPVLDCGAACPPNALQLTTLSDGVRATLAMTCYGLVSIIGLGVVALHLSRILRASKPRRRALAGLGVTSMLVFPAAALLGVGLVTIGSGGAERVGLTVVMAVAAFVFPVGFAIPLVTADLAAGNELQGMLGDLTARPSRAAWRDRVALALDDLAVRIGYWEESTATFVEPNGRELSKADVSEDHLWVAIAQGDQPVAAVATDPALATDPELTEAVAMAMIAASTTRSLETAQREVSARAAAAVELERNRVAREIKAGPQQRLAALRVHVSVLGSQSEDGANQSFIQEFGEGLDKAMQELGDATRTRTSSNLAGQGLSAALRAARDRSALTVRIWDRGLRRHPARSELAVYYCALEAIQNTIKHAGAGAAVTIRLFETGDGIGFTIEDDGSGFDLETVVSGSGLGNMIERVEDLGGLVSVASAVGIGTVISGSIPDVRDPQ
jgi:signal transduction histidine kinase